MTGTAMAFGAFAMVAGGLIWWFRLAMRVQLPSNRAPFVLWMSAAGVLGLLGLAGGSGWLPTSAAAVGVLGAMFVLGTVAISAQKVDGAIGVGDQLPSFQALDEDEQPVDGASLIGSGPLLLKFFRGHW